MRSVSKSSILAGVTQQCNRADRRCSSGVHAIVGVPNDELLALGSSPSTAAAWVACRVLPFTGAVGDKSRRGGGGQDRPGAEDELDEAAEMTSTRVVGRSSGSRKTGLGSSFFGSVGGSSFFGGGTTFGSSGGGLGSSFLGGGGGGLGSSFLGNGGGGSSFGGGGGGTTSGSDGGSLGSTFLGGGRGEGHRRRRSGGRSPVAGGGSAERENLISVMKRVTSLMGYQLGTICLMNSHRWDLYRVSVVVCVIGWRQP
jgi:hypothetical protein